MGWKTDTLKYLEETGYVPPAKRIYSVSTPDGKALGEVSYSAKTAIERGELDDYVPKNDTEKTIFDELRKIKRAQDFQNKHNELQAKQNASFVNGDKVPEVKEDNFFQWLGKQVQAGIVNSGAALASTLDWLVPGAGGKYDYAHKYNEWYKNQKNIYQQAATDSSIQKGGGNWYLGGELVSGTVDAVPNAVMAAVTGGASVTPQLGAQATSTAPGVLNTIKTIASSAAKNPMFWTSFARTIGSDYEEAKEKGASEVTAQTTAIITSLLNAGVEIGGGIETLPKNLKSGEVSAVKSWVESMIDEGKEEVVQGMISRGIAKLSYDKDKKFVSLTDDEAVLNLKASAKEFGMGAAVGGILGGAQIGTQTGLNRMSKKIDINKRISKINTNIQTAQDIIDRNKAAIGRIQRQDSGFSHRNIEIKQLQNTNNRLNDYIQDANDSIAWLKERGLRDNAEGLQDGKKIYPTHYDMLSGFIENNSGKTSSPNAYVRVKKSSDGNYEVTDLYGQSKIKKANAVEGRYISLEEIDALSKARNKAIENMFFQAVENAGNHTAEQARKAAQLANRSIINEAKKSNLFVDTEQLANINLIFAADQDNIITEEFVKSYADLFTEAMKKGKKFGYTQLARISDDVAGLLTDVVMGRKVPADITSGSKTIQRIFSDVTGGFQSFLKSGVTANQKLHDILYAENPVLTRQSSDAQRGDFSTIRGFGQNIDVANSVQDDIIGLNKNETEAVQDGRNQDRSRDAQRGNTESFSAGEMANNGERYSEMPPTQAGKSVDDRFNTGLYEPSGRTKLDGSGNEILAERTKENTRPESGSVLRGTETKALEHVYETPEFKTLYTFVGNEISAEKRIEFINAYVNDARLNEGYDITALIVCDMLAGKNPELAELFQDQIAEYYLNSESEYSGKGREENANLRRSQTEDGEQNAADNIRSVNSNGESANELSAGEQAAQVQEGYAGDDVARQRLHNGREESIEGRTIEDVCELNSFVKLEAFIGKEISIDTSNNLLKKYRYDKRLEDGYEIRDLYTYDILAGKHPELAELFQDAISEYFQTEKLPSTDITGRTVPGDILKATEGSIVRNDAGQLIPVYHSTQADFEAFLPGDVGIHFGSRAQAEQRAKNKDLEEGVRIIQAYLNIQNPIVLQEDTFGWNAGQIAQILERNGVLTHEEAMRFTGDGAEQNAEMRRLLQDKGYDGIIYQNNFESTAGKSYIVFDDSQVFHVDSDSGTQKKLQDLFEKNASSKITSNNSLSASNDISQEKDTVKNDMREDTSHTNQRDTKRWTAERNDGATAEKGLKSLSDIVSFIANKFGIPISTGNIRQRNTNGIYKNGVKAIRINVTNAIPTISHELGHYLDEKYGLSRSEYIQEVLSHADKDFLDLYKENEKPHEAVAEFVREYLRNTDVAKETMPNFFEHFEKTLDANDLKNMRIAANAINQYLSQSYGERVDAAIASKNKKTKRTLSEILDDLKTDYVDEYSPIKDVMDFVQEISGESIGGQKNAYTLAVNSLNASAVASSIVSNGMTNLNGDINIGKSFIECIEDVDGKDMGLFSRYLVLKHAVEWLSNDTGGSVKRVFADETLQDVDSMRQELENLQEEHPKFVEAAENLYEYQRNIMKNFLVDSGVMSNELFDKLQKMYPHYVPFYRALERNQAGDLVAKAKSGFANQKLPLMRAKGSGASIVSPLESVIRNTEKYVKCGMRNRVTQSLAEWAEIIPGMGAYIENVPPNLIPKSVDISTQKKNIAKALENKLNAEDYFSVTEILDGMLNDIVTDFTPIADSKRKIISVFKDGKAKYYQIHNEKLYNAISGLSTQQLNGFFKISAQIMQPMKILITQNNPIFATTNAIRDVRTAFMMSDIGDPIQFANLYVKALSEVISKSEDYKRFLAMGGGHSSDLSASIDSVQRMLNDVKKNSMAKAARTAYSLFLHPIQKIADINDIVETIPRFMEFKRTLDVGKNIQDAIYNASDITTNFKLSGSKGRNANSLFMFNNAAIQGLYKMYRSFADVPKAERNARIFKYLLSALFLAALSEFFNRSIDEEGYNNLSSYTKNNFHCFALGDGKFIKLPKAREVSILDSFIERCVDMAFADKDAFYDFGGYLAQNLLPPCLEWTTELPKVSNSVHALLGNTAIGGLIDIGFNRDFKGTPIEGRYDESLPRKDRYSERTSKLAVMLGQTKLAGSMELSPKQIDHLISNYTGIIGQLNQAWFPNSKEQTDYTAGLRNKFVADSVYSTDLLNKMYDFRDEAKEKFEYDNTIENAMTYEKGAVAADYITEMNKSIRNLPENQQRNGRTYLLRSLSGVTADYTDADKKMISNLEGKTVDKDIFLTELPGAKMTWTKDKKKYEYTMTPSEYNEFIKQYLSIVDRMRSKIKFDEDDRYIENLKRAKSEAKTRVNQIFKKKLAKKAVAKGR